MKIREVAVESNATKLSISMHSKKKTIKTLDGAPRYRTPRCRNRISTNPLFFAAPTVDWGLFRYAPENFSRAKPSFWIRCRKVSREIPSQRAARS